MASYSIKINVKNTPNIDSLLGHFSYMGIDYEVEEVKNTSINQDDSQMNNIKLKPSEHFKFMCGNEVLNSKGLISKKDTLDLLNYYIKRHSLIEEDGIIYMNRWFQELVQEFMPTIYRYELPKLVNKFFD